MAKDSGIDFVRIDILENWRFWNGYAQRGDYEGAGKEVVAQANAMLAQDTESNERAARLINESLEFKRKKSEAGKIGGKASAAVRWGDKGERKEPPVKKEPVTKTLNPYQAIKPPRNRSEVFDFANDHGIPDGYAIDWYEQNASRGWKDKDGNPIINWKGALISYHKAQENKP